MLGPGVRAPGGCLTFRAANTYEAWWEMEWNRPDRLCWYLMQLSAEVRRSWVKDKFKPRADHFRIPFQWKTDGRDEDESEEMTPDEASRRALERFLPMFGGAKITTYDPDGNLVEWDGSLYPDGRPDLSGGAGRVISGTDN